MAYDIQLTDGTGTATLPLTEVPLTTTPIEGAIDVQTLSYNVYTDFITQKRTWSHTWAYLSATEYAILKGYYDRQFTAYTYPYLTIADESVTAIPVRMTINAKNIIDNCGLVQGVTVSFRETNQLGS